MDKFLFDTIWASLCQTEDYLVAKACEDYMLDETRLAYLSDLKACREAKVWLIGEQIDNG